MAQERDHKQDEKYIKNDFGNSSSCQRNSAEAQDCSNQRNHEKSESPSKHSDLRREKLFEALFPSRDMNNSSDRVLLYGGDLKLCKNGL
jgi:hypothetical protein